MDMEAGLELKLGQHGREHIHQAHLGMVCHQMAAAVHAEFAVALFGLAEFAHMRGTFGDLQVFRVPQGEPVHRRGRLGPTAFTVAITHAFGGPRDQEFHGSAKALALENVI